MSKIVAVISLMISLPLFIGILFLQASPDELILTNFIRLLALLYLVFSIYVTFDTFTTYLKYNKEKIIFYSLWNGKREFLWNDLNRIQFSENAKWYILTFNNKDKIRLSLYLVGSTFIVEHLESLGLKLEFT